MEIDLALVADAATIDGSGKLNILGVFDRIDAQGFPARHGRISLVLRFAGDLKDAGRHHMRISLKAPSGEEVLGMEGALQLGPGPVSEGMLIPHVINFDGVVFPAPGRYAFDVVIDGEHTVAVPLNVGSLRGPPAQA